MNNCNKNSISSNASQLRLTNNANYHKRKLTGGKPHSLTDLETNVRSKRLNTFSEKIIMHVGRGGSTGKKLLQ